MNDGLERAAALRQCRAAMLAFLGALLLSTSAALAQSPPRPEVNPGQVQQRIPAPPEGPHPPATLALPAPTAPAAVAPQRFVLSAVVITGATVFDSAQLASAYEDDLAREIDLAEVDAILGRITARYRARGYFLSRATAPPQSLESGILHIVVEEGYVAHLDFGDASAGEETMLRPYFAPVLASRPLRLPVLERALLLVNDLAGLRVSGRLAPVAGTPSAYTLVLTLRHRRIAGFAAIDNRGPNYLGPWNAQASASLAGLLAPYDRTQLSLFTVPDRPRELVSGEVTYDVPLDSSGTDLFLSGGRTALKPGGSLASLALDGTATHYVVRVSHALIRSRAQSLWLAGALDVLDSSENEAGARLFDDRLRMLHASAIYSLSDSLGGTNSIDVDVTQGLDAFGASKPGSTLLSRANGRADFTKATLFATRQQGFGEHWGIQIDLAAQKALQPLLTTAQFALGGTRFGRGYDPAEITGDDALAGSLELRYGDALDGPVLRRWQLYLFYDAGAVWNIDPAGPSEQSLASAGGGLRLSFARGVGASLELAQPLTRAVAAEHGKPLRAFASLWASF